MPSPAFTARYYQQGERVTSGGLEWESRKAGNRTALPTNGAYWAQVSNAVVKDFFYHGTLDLHKLGLVPNVRERAAENARLLAAVIAEYPDSHLMLPRGVCWLDKVPGSGLMNPREHEYAITLRDTHLTLEAEYGGVFQTLAGVPGLQACRTSGSSSPTLKNITLSHENGRFGAGDHGVIGEENGRKLYTEDFGEYRINGISMWSQGHLEGVRVVGFPGNGMTVFGSRKEFVPATPFAVSGKVQVVNGEVAFTPDTKEALALLLIDSMVKLGRGPERRVGGYQQGYVFLGAPWEGMQDGVMDGAAYQPSHHLFADHITSGGLNNFDSNGGLGVFTTGDEANASNFTNFSARDNGSWGFCDSSLEANLWVNRHTSANGRNFNIYDGRDPMSWPVGGFTTRGDASGHPVLIGGYTEGGDSGPDRVSQRTVYVPGQYAAGIVGGRNAGAFDSYWMQKLAEHGITL